MLSARDPGIKHEALFADHKHGYDCPLAVVVYYLGVGLNHLVPVLVNCYVRTSMSLGYYVVMDAPVERNLCHDMQAVRLYPVQQVIVYLIDVLEARQIGALGLSVYPLPSSVCIEQLVPRPEP